MCGIGFFIMYFVTKATPMFQNVANLLNLLYKLSHEYNSISDKASTWQCIWPLSSELPSKFKANSLNTLDICKNWPLFYLAMNRSKLFVRLVSVSMFQVLSYKKHCLMIAWQDNLVENSVVSSAGVVGVTSPAVIVIPSNSTRVANYTAPVFSFMTGTNSHCWQSCSGLHGCLTPFYLSKHNK